jgi:hypothetical protein
MNKEFIPDEQALELKELGFNDVCLGYHNIDPYLPKSYFNLVRPFDHEWCLPAPLYQQAFRWFREKYNFRYSIGDTNIAVVHYLGTTQLLQNNDSYEAAELAAIKWFIDVAKQIENGKD